MDRHKGRAGESARAYRRRRLGHFRSQLAGRQAVYLDINHWIELEKVAAGTSGNAAYVALLGLLRDKVSARVLFCPTSASLLMELAKQNNPVTRAATARLMDALSAGAALMADDDLVTLEVGELLDAALAKRTLIAPRDQVWMPVGCVAADVIPPAFPAALTPQMRQRIEKIHFDNLLEVSAEALAGMHEPHDRSTWMDLAKTLNEGTAAHQHEIGGFDDLLLAELIGTVEASARMVAGSLDDFRTRHGLPATLSLRSPQWLRLIALALRQNVDARAAVPSLFVRAGLHALLRWNRTQKFKPNDIFDFAHAAGAIGYSDVFITERRSKTCWPAAHCGWRPLARVGLSPIRKRPMQSSRRSNGCSKSLDPYAVAKLWPVVTGQTASVGLPGSGPWQRRTRVKMGRRRKPSDFRRVKRCARR
jgi:hypothetical protein